MKLVLAEPKFLRDSVSIISELVNEATFKITTNGMELIAMDPANVAMVIFKLLSSAFQEFKVEEEIDLSINLSNFKQILKRAKPSDVLILEIDENKLKLTFEGKNKRTFYLPIMDVDGNDQKVPDLSFPIHVTTQTQILDEAIADVDVVAESVAFIIKGNKLIIQAEGDLSKAKIEIDADDSTKIDAEKDARAKYSIEYLKKMIAASKISNDVTIEFNENYPLKLAYTTMDKVLLSFILAPRVEND